MGNENFYLRMVKLIPGDPNFQKLYDSIEKGDLEGAFSAAHALKGSTGNLSLTPHIRSGVRDRGTAEEENGY